jgi:UDP-N-acetylmuramoyl-L-alanyl-D-glutamate--2,6-diaminopimelate ligase
MKIRDLLSALPEEKKAKKKGSIRDSRWDPRWMEVTDLTSDSRQVQKGSVFVAIRGTKFDAHQELAAVCAREPAAVVVEDPAKVPADFKGLVVEVGNTRQALAILAARYFGDPSLHFFCFGVTGTNGKTSCTFIMEHILNRMHVSTGVIGTIHHRLGEKIWPTDSTTPGPIELQSRLAEMRAAGARALAMEVSSHALDQYRVDGIHFNAVLFTNLTRDHLDYHETMERYFQSKQRLFTDLLWQSRKGPMVAAVNAEDPWGRRLKVAFPAEIFTYGQSEDADFHFRPIEMGFDETKFFLRSPFGELETSVPLCGLHNISNVVGCVAAATALGIAPAVALRSLVDFPGVPGRLQPVPNNRGLSVFVDYAHSPDALENVLKALLEVRKTAEKNGKITVVFGCGGDRDKGKRPLMAEVAEKYADSIIVTSDNPRTEDPQAILQDIERGLKGSKPARSIVDRREAIAAAIRGSQAGDVVLIAGKGHEDYQILGTEKIHFSDFEAAMECFR